LIIRQTCVEMAKVLQYMSKKSLTHYYAMYIKLKATTIFTSIIRIKKIKNSVQIILISEQCNECYNYKQY
jgi:hypothetical protein